MSYTETPVREPGCEIGTKQFYCSDNLPDLDGGRETMVRR